MRELRVDVFGIRSIRGDEEQVDLGLGARRRFDLGLFSGFADVLSGRMVATEINAALLLELVQGVVDKDDSEVFTTKVRVAIRGLDLGDARVGIKGSGKGLRSGSIGGGRDG